MHNSKKVYIVMYHYTRDLYHSRYPSIKGMDVDLFRRQINFFVEKFNVITMDELLEAVHSGDNIALPDDAVVLTFDDGYIDNYTVALPILEKYGVQGSFFVPGKTFAEHKLLDVNKIHFILSSAKIEEIANKLKERMDYYRGLEFDYPPTSDLYNEYAVASRYDDPNTVFVKKMLQTVLPEKVRNHISSELFECFVGISEETLAYELYMHVEQIELLKRHGMYIGIHGYDHYWLGNLDRTHMQQDIDKALTVMDEFIDRDNWVMNYPYGSYNDDVVEYISSKGAKLGLTTEVRMADVISDNPFLMPRFDCNDFPPKSNIFLIIR